MESIEKPPSFKLTRENLQRGGEKVKDYWLGRLREKEYATVVVGARYDQSPLIMKYKGLPLHLVAREAAEEMAGEVLGDGKVKMERVYLISTFDVWFEFVRGEEAVYVNAFNFETVSWTELADRDSSPCNPVQQELKKNRWREIERFAAEDREDIAFFRSATTRVISNVPDFNQFDNTYASGYCACGCANAAGGNVLGYLDYLGYQNTWDEVNDPEGRSLINELREATETFCGNGQGVTYDSKVAPGMLAVFEGKGYGSLDYYQYCFNNWCCCGYTFPERLHYWIDMGYPFYLSSSNIPGPLDGTFPEEGYGSHAVTAIGYEGDYPIVHDNWQVTGRDVTLGALFPEDWGIGVIIPSQSQQLKHDDGSLESSWYSNGAGFAVRFTPAAYPFTLNTARIVLSACGWPDPGGNGFKVMVYDDDGRNGSPQTLLSDTITITNGVRGDWSDVNLKEKKSGGGDIVIRDGSFYVLYLQVGNFPNCPGLMTDKDGPFAHRSWSFYNGLWELLDSEYGNFGIRSTGVCSAVPPPDEHVLSVAVYPDGGGTVSKDPDKPSYDSNETVTITALPNSGYFFDYWGGDATGSDSATSIIMNGDKMATAYFKKGEWPFIYQKILKEFKDGYLPALRKYRDKVLVKDPLGRRYVDLLYRHSGEVARILLNDQGLRSQAGDIIGKIIPIIKSLPDGKRMVLPREQIEEIKNFLDNFVPDAGPELLAVIEQLKEDLEKEKIFPVK